MSDFVYRFSFDSKYDGHTAVITDGDGEEVTGSPITLDADGDGSLAVTAAGVYRAQVDNAFGGIGDGYSVVEGVFDQFATIAAGGGTTAPLTFVSFEGEVSGVATDAQAVFYTGGFSQPESDDGIVPDWIELGEDSITIIGPRQVYVENVREPYVADGVTPLHAALVQGSNAADSDDISFKVFAQTLMLFGQSTAPSHPGGRMINVADSYIIRPAISFVGYDTEQVVVEDGTGGEHITIQITQTSPVI